MPSSNRRKTKLKPWIATIPLLIYLAASDAPPSAVGSYAVQFQETSTNCNANKLSFPDSTLQIRLKDKQLIVDISRASLMIGTEGKNGKIQAKSKKSPTFLNGIDGVYNIAGVISTDGKINAVMTAELSERGRALCTQAWTVTGNKRK